MTKGGVIEKYLTEAEPKNEIKFILTNFIWEPNFISSAFNDIIIKLENKLN